MAGVTSGTTEISSCSTCTDELKEFLGCENPTQMPVWEVLADDSGEVYKFYRCPVLFLKHEVLEWYEEYNLLKKGMILPERYNDRQARWYEAVKYYEKFLDMFMRQKQGNKGK